MNESKICLYQVKKMSLKLKLENLDKKQICLQT